MNVMRRGLLAGVGVMWAICGVGVGCAQEEVGPGVIAAEPERATPEEPLAAPKRVAQRSSAREGEYAAARSRMVRMQLEGSVFGRTRVRDQQVLEAMRSVPRHLFVPEEMRAAAYRDGPLPIGHGQTISQPYIVARMTEIIAPGPDDVVLEVGTGSGYQAAVLGEIVKAVYTIEIVEPLGERAARLLERLGYDNVHVRIGDGYAGWPEHAPFDGIIVTAAPDHVPEPLVEQLAPGGKMIIPVGPEWGTQLLTLIEKDAAGEVTRRRIEPVRFVPFTGEGVEEGRN